jgi:2,3-bisphosphoglycerate-dependent phosphoglycerate mutase
LGHTPTHKGNMELYFIRHGQSENNANWGLDGFQDVPDPELTNIGVAQAEHLARFLGSRQPRDEVINWNSQNRHGYGLTHIYTSLMVRAVSTAKPTAEALGLPLVAWPEIHETGGIFAREDGDERAGLPGKTRSYFQKHFPGMVLPRWVDDNGWWNRPFEEAGERKPRAERVWSDLLGRHGDREGQREDRVAIVSHGGFFMYLFTTALGVNLRRIQESLHEYWFLMNNCSITRLDVKDNQVLVAYTNRNDYLPDHLIT